METGEPVDACYVAWSSNKRAGPLEIEGAVRTSMADLRIENVSFLDELGNELPWKVIRKFSSPKVVQQPINYAGIAKFKERLVRQIIRKHLLEQGMRIDGANVEICLARG